MEEKYLELAGWIINMVDAYCNTDALFDDPFWEGKTLYEQLKEALADMIKEFDKKRQNEIVDAVIKMLRTEDVDGEPYYSIGDIEKEFSI